MTNSLHRLTHAQGVSTPDTIIKKLVSLPTFSVLQVKLLETQQQDHNQKLNAPRGATETPNKTAKSGKSKQNKNILRALPINPNCCQRNYQ